MNTKYFTIAITRATGENNTALETKEFFCGLNGFRATVNIELGGLPSKNIADVSIYGLSLESLQNYTSLIFLPPKVFDKRNQIDISIDNAPVYKGDTRYCFADFSTFPNVSLRAQGVFGLANSLTPVKSQTIYGKDKLPIATVFETLAKQMGYSFVNNGVEGNCPDVILYGTLFEQANYLAKILNVGISLFNNYLMIAPYGKPFWNGRVKINKTNGLIGYPSFNSNGVTFRTIYNPLIKVGCLVELESIVPKASGTWYVNSISTNLSTIENGLWESEVECFVQQ